MNNANQKTNSEVMPRYQGDDDINVLDYLKGDDPQYKEILPILTAIATDVIAKFDFNSNNRGSYASIKIYPNYQAYEKLKSISYKFSIEKSYRGNKAHADMGLFVTYDPFKDITAFVMITNGGSVGYKPIFTSFSQSEVMASTLYNYLTRILLRRTESLEVKVKSTNRKSSNNSYKRNNNNDRNKRSYTGSNNNIRTRSNATNTTTNGNKRYNSNTTSRYKQPSTNGTTSNRSNTSYNRRPSNTNYNSNRNKYHTTDNRY